MEKNREEMDVFYHVRKHMYTGEGIDLSIIDEITTTLWRFRGL